MALSMRFLLRCQGQFSDSVESLAMDVANHHVYFGHAYLFVFEIAAEFAAEGRNAAIRYHRLVERKLR